MNGLTPGGIRCPEAYAQGKMLDHSSWYGLMARKITPSDIDMVVESYGCFLFCELSRDADSMATLSRGQRIMLSALSRLNGTHCVAILTHGLLSHSKPIDTATDIRSACVYFDAGTKRAILDGDGWIRFAAHWTFDPAGAVSKCLRLEELQHGR
jgi:hypothetical protein